VTTFSVSCFCVFFTRLCFKLVFGINMKVIENCDIFLVALVWHENMLCMIYYVFTKMHDELLMFEYGCYMMNCWCLNTMLYDELLMFEYDVIYDWWFMIWMYMSLNMMLYDVVHDWWIIMWMYMLIKYENCRLDDLCCWLLWNIYYEKDVLMKVIVVYTMQVVAIYAIMNSSWFILLFLLLLFINIIKL